MGLSGSFTFCGVSHDVAAASDMTAAASMLCIFIVILFCVCP
jgi:hypothetical protein